MKKLLKKSLYFVVVLALLLSSVISVSAAPAKYSTASNSGTRDELCTTLDGTTAASYYTGSNSYDSLVTLSSSQLLTTLRSLMTTGHKTSSYDDCRDLAPITDCENGNGKITTLYTSYQTTSGAFNGGTGWNREHVWPKSLGGYGNSGAGADLHHIRPTENRTNSNRDNLLYGNVTGGKTSTGNLSGEVGGTYDSTYFEPLDNVKGDVARICLYVYVRWGGTSGYTCNNINKVFEDVDTLLEWCALDPVDTWEMGRNEVVYSIQGNRNVFIDYPELAWQLFGETAPSDMSTPSGKASSTPAVCQHKSTTVTGAKAATCTTAGYTGDTVCTSCGIVVVTGNVIVAIGHSYSAEIVVRPPTETDHGEAATVCGNCGTTEMVLIPALGTSNPDTEDTPDNSENDSKTEIEETEAAEKKGFFARIIEAIKNFFANLFGKEE